MTVATRGMIQPDIMASRNGMQRLTVRPVSVTERWGSVIGGSFRNQSGRAPRAGMGGGITPSSPGSQVKVMADPVVIGGSSEA